MGNLNKTVTATMTLAIAVAIAWLATVVLHRWADHSLPIVALLELHGILAWQLHWRRELKYRIPVSPLGGAALLSMLPPVPVASRFPNRELFSIHHCFYAVNWEFTDAAVFARVILLIAPVKLGEIETGTMPKKNGGITMR